jgi:Heterokaryon incompatibility protein (HET)
MDVLPNLGEASRSLRDESRERAVWIDVTYIDQANQLWVSEQVQQISSIYQSVRSYLIVQLDVYQNRG